MFVRLSTCNRDLPPLFAEWDSVKKVFTRPTFSTFIYALEGGLLRCGAP